MNLCSGNLFAGRPEQGWLGRNLKLLIQLQVFNGCFVAPDDVVGTIRRPLITAQVMRKIFISLARPSAET